jgi:heterodisulfide reductase subunit A
MSAEISPEPDLISTADSSQKSVLVVGAGIPGIQTATDLADMGFNVFLVEKSPSI